MFAKSRILFNVCEKINEVRLTKSQIDRLGDRLRQGKVSEADLRLLDGYRRSFMEAYETVVNTMRRELKLELTGRPAKSTASIIEKLYRESVRLTQMQDIAGCRLIVDDVCAQDAVVGRIARIFEGSNVFDRRECPSCGYRAVHVVVKWRGKLVEIQVRSVLQHLWAELSEKMSDVIDPALKYGGGDENAQMLLMTASKRVRELEMTEGKMKEAEGKMKALENAAPDDVKTMVDAGRAKVDAGRALVDAWLAEISATRNKLAKIFEEMLVDLTKIKE